MKTISQISKQLGHIQYGNGKENGNCLQNLIEQGNSMVTKQRNRRRQAKKKKYMKYIVVVICGYLYYYYNNSVLMGKALTKSWTISPSENCK